MKGPFHKCRKVTVSLLLAGIAALLAILVVQRSSGLRILSSPPPPQKSRLAFLGPWMWPVKMRLLRIRQAVFGAPQVVQLDALIAEFHPGTAFREFQAHSAVTNGNGDIVMVLADDALARELITTRPGAGVISKPRIVTADGVQAEMTSSQQVPLSNQSNAPLAEVGWRLRVRPRIRSEGIDLMCFVTQSEMNRHLQDGPAVRTNLAFGAQARVPPGAFLLLVGGATNQHGKAVGVLLSPSVPGRK